jgi:UDP-N-acetylglucosamine 2-epimerase (non-hydrolysing)
VKIKTFLFIYGTRPEAIKLAPLIKLISKNSKNRIKVCNTGQHKELLEGVFNFFKIKQNFNLNVISKNQSLSELTSLLIKKISKVIKKVKPDLVIVQGDTTSAMAGAYVAFLNKIKVAHIEAGLRTHDISSPFPEEMNRNIISKISTFHFAPTVLNKKNLLDENIKNNKIHVVGNTVIDAIFFVKKYLLKKKNRISVEKKIKTKNKEILKKKFILLTCHRRENFGKKLLRIFNSIIKISKIKKNYNIIFPVHLNPAISKISKKYLSKYKNIFLVKPMRYEQFVYMLIKSSLVITDSGGIQEELSVLNKDTLIIRENTERNEVTKLKNMKLVGSNEIDIVKNALKMLNENKKKKKYKNKTIYLFGKGNSSKKIIKILNKFNFY